MSEGWQWDESLFRGSASHYTRGRLPYAPGLLDRLVAELELDGHGRLLDVGCGPGTLTLMLAPYFDEAVGVDPDPDMLAEAERRCTEAGIGNARWVRARAEELPGGIEACNVALFGQSFHWMDRARVALIVHGMLEPGGALVHVSDIKEDCPREEIDLPYPGTPYGNIQALMRSYLGPVRRAGQGVLRYGTPDIEWGVLQDAGFINFQAVRVPGGGKVVREVDDVIAWVWSRSDSAPHLFGDQIERFETELRQLLADASPSGFFAERLPDTEVFVWRTPQS